MAWGAQRKGRGEGAGETWERRERETGYDSCVDSAASTPPQLGSKEEEGEEGEEGEDDLFCLALCLSQEMWYQEGGEGMREVAAGEEHG